MGTGPRRGPSRLGFVWRVLWVCCVVGGFSLLYGADIPAAVSGPARLSVSLHTSHPFERSYIRPGATDARDRPSQVPHENGFIAMSVHEKRVHASLRARESDTETARRVVLSSTASPVGYRGGGPPVQKYPTGSHRRVIGNRNQRSRMAASKSRAHRGFRTGPG